MQNYSKPVVLENEELAEGVYAAGSGEATGGALAKAECWEIGANIHQTPQTGREDYRIQITGKHINTDRHLSKVWVTIAFNQPVVFKECNGGTKISDGMTVVIERNIGTYNSGEGLGLGDLVVTSGDGLKITDVGYQCLGLGLHS
ncbi:MAG: hypothetical protein J1F63_01540 [Oscillospiraceae bacterium]|nr:hypothetical protein [Oscillospiraceae bacterium]